MWPPSRCRPDYGGVTACARLWVMTQSSSPTTPHLLLLAPSANRVYAEAAIDLTVAELSVFARTVLSGRIHDIAATTVAGLDCVGFGASALSADDIAML